MIIILFIFCIFIFYICIYIYFHDFLLFSDLYRVRLFSDLFTIFYSTVQSDQKYFILQNRCLMLKNSLFSNRNCILFCRVYCYVFISIHTEYTTSTQSSMSIMLCVHSSYFYIISQYSDCCCCCVMQRCSAYALHILSCDVL